MWQHNVSDPAEPEKRDFCSCCPFPGTLWVLIPNHVWFANAFSRFVGCLFIFLVIYFAAQKLFSFLSTWFFFVAYALGVVSEK